MGKVRRLKVYSVVLKSARVRTTMQPATQMDARKEHQREQEAPEAAPRSADAPDGRSVKVTDPESDASQIGRAHV